MKRLKTSLAFLCTLCILCALISGCSQGSGSDNDSAIDSGGSIEANDTSVTENQEVVTIDVFQFQVETHDQVVATAENYMALHPNITINVETVGGGQDWKATLKAKMASNEQPDIIMLEGPSDLLEWSEYLEDLSDQVWASDIQDAVLDSCMLDGNVVMLPFSCIDYGLIYNMEMFADAGIDMTGVDSYDEIDAAFAALKAKIDSGEMSEKYPLLEAVVEYPAKEQWVLGMHSANPAIALEVGDSMSALGTETIEFTYSDALKDYVDLQVKYTKSADNPSALNAVDYAAALGGGLSIERVAVIQMGQWVMPEVLAVDPEMESKLGLLPIPLKGINENSIVVGIGGGWVVNKNGSPAELAAAKEYLTWWNYTEEGQAEYANDIIMTGFMNPPLEPTNVIAKAGIEYVNAGNTIPVSFGGFPTGFSDRLGSGIQSYLSGSTQWDDMIEVAKEDWAALR